MSVWRATKARRVLHALQRIGWTQIRQVGSHRTLSRAGEIGPGMLAKLAKHTGLTPSDL